MNKDNIVIKSIEPVYEETKSIGYCPTIKQIQIGLKVIFDYKKMKGITLPIQTDRINDEEIKDKIIEVINS